MAEYIERDSLILDIEANKLMAREPAAKRILQMIENQHTADVRPERHGHWGWADDGYLRCSECTQKAIWVQPYEDEPMQEETNYCQYCGAKMDGKDDENGIST